MCSRPDGVTVAPMIQIEVDAAEPPTGRVTVGADETPRPFVGWLQLLSLLGEALAAEGPADRRA